MTFDEWWNTEMKGFPFSTPSKISAIHAWKYQQSKLDIAIAAFEFYSSPDITFACGNCDSETMTSGFVIPLQKKAKEALEKIK